MKDIRDLKMYIEMVVSMSKIETEEKHQLLNFIHNEATEAQIKAFIMDGEVVPVTEASTELINERFKLYEVEVNKKYREFEGGITKFIKYGIMAIIGLPFGVILPMAFLWFYRHMTDKCVKGCGGVAATKDCYNMCYLNASKKVLVKVTQELSNAGKIPDEKKKAKAIKKLQSEKEKWAEKVKNYENRIKAIRVRNQQQEK